MLFCLCAEAAPFAKVGAPLPFFTDGARRSTGLQKNNHLKNAPPPQKNVGLPWCKYDNHMLSLFLSSLFITGIIGALTGGKTCVAWGRRPTMILGGAFLLISRAAAPPAPSPNVRSPSSYSQCFLALRVRAALGRFASGLPAGCW